MNFKAELELKTYFQPLMNGAVSAVSSILYQCLSSCFLVYIGDPDQKSHDAGSVSTKPASTDQSPASAQPSAPALGDQTASSGPHHQHPNTFQNEVMMPTGRWALRSGIY